MLLGASPDTAVATTVYGQTYGQTSGTGGKPSESPARTSRPKIELDFRPGSADTRDVDAPQPYQIEGQPTLLKQMKGIPAHEQRRILERIYQLADEPRPAGAEKLTDVGGWRIRIGDYRVVYWIDDSQRVVTVTRVRKRGDVYRRK